jgi:hypothetical protein
MGAAAADGDDVAMTYRTAPQPARRLVLVPASSSGRDDELVRRYRLARLRLSPPPRAAREPKR